MKILLAPNALKGSLTAMQAASAMEQGIRSAFPEADVRKVPAADGRDGLAEVLIAALGGEARVAPVRFREVLEGLSGEAPRPGDELNAG